MILWELLLINTAVNILMDVEVVPQGVLILLVTPPEMVKIRNIAGLHVNRQVISLQKVSLLFLGFVNSAMNHVL